MMEKNSVDAIQREQPSRTFTLSGVATAFGGCRCIEPWIAQNAMLFDQVRMPLWVPFFLTMPVSGIDTTALRTSDPQMVRPRVRRKLFLKVRMRTNEGLTITDDVNLSWIA